jgi:hypothetical protein
MRRFLLRAAVTALLVTPAWSGNLAHEVVNTVRAMNVNRDLLKKPSVFYLPGNERASEGRKEQT